jgi:hypothetical protein
MTFKLKILLLSFCVACLTNCYSQITLPKNLDEAILYFQQNWTKKELDDFKKKSESNAIADLHFGTGLWIRNNWVRGNRDTALTNYFHSFGIANPDDISSIILTSLHRKLNNKSINLDKQVEEYKAYWKPIIDCNEKVKATALLNYNKYKLGDNISIYMPVNENKNAVIYECPDISWKFKANKDLLIKGQILKKYFINDTSNVFFTLKITSINHNDIQVLMTPVKVGDNKDFSLRGLKLD